MRPFMLSAVLCLLVATGSTQKSNNIWLFGNMAGLDFNESPPLSLSSPLVADEGSASISDPNGDLLFYTNGKTIWDRTHQAMPNGGGLIGGSSSTQAALIVPQPGSLHLYYVFTPEDHFGDGDLAYSVVDMCLNNGLGDVIAGQKNIVISTNAAEKISAILHSNEKDVWIVSHELGSRNFISFLLSATGLSATPTVSTIGSSHPGNAFIGPIKASHNGKKIVCAATFFDICEMFDFDNTTGVVSNLINLANQYANLDFAYGIEFSPNDSILYISTCFGANDLHQIDIAKNTQITLQTIPGNYTFGALQLAPDNKIYLARNNRDFLGVITEPNNTGLACGYVQQGQMLVPGTTASLGLPNFVPFSFFIETPVFPDLGNDTIVCNGNSISFDFSATNQLQFDFMWDDGSTNHSNTFSQSGLHWVEISDGCYTYRDSINISFSTYPDLDLPDTAFCSGEGVLLDATVPNVTYLWNDSSTNPTLFVNAPGDYWVELSNECGIDTAFVNVTIGLPPDIDLGPDTSLCQGEGLTLSLPSGAFYTWSDGSMDSLFDITVEGTYSVIAQNACGNDTDEIYVEIIPVPAVFVADQTFCEGQSVIVNVPLENVVYEWYDGTDQPSSQFDIAGDFWVAVSNACGHDTAFFTLAQDVLPNVNLGPDTVLCDGESILLEVPYIATYLWSNGSMDSILDVSAEGTYWVVAQNTCGSDTDDIYVQILPVPDIFVSSQTFCEDQNLTIDVSTDHVIYEWYNGSTEASLEFDAPGDYWVVVSNNCGIDTAYFTLESDVIPNFTLGPDTTLCDGQSIVLQAYGGNIYEWSDGSDGVQLLVTQPGNYWAVVSNTCGSDTSSISISLDVAPVVLLAQDTGICNGQSLVLNVSYPGANYFWSDNSTDSTLQITQAGDFWVNVSNHCGTTMSSISVSEIEVPDISLGSDTALCDGASLTLSVSTPYSTYVWSDNSTNPLISISSPGTYWVSVTNACGSDVAEITITQETCSISVFIPNVFSPNHDGTNDNFAPFINGQFDGYRLTIFDRWGEVVFISDQYGFAWDGTFKTRNVPAGVYVYILTVESSYEGLKQYSGDVTLIR